MANIIKTRFQIRRGTQEDFDAANPILRAGEPAYAINTNVFKIGDGITPWKDLPSINGGDISNITIINGGKADGYENP